MVDQVLGFVDCPKHGQFPYVTDSCPGCRNEEIVRKEEELATREKRRSELSGQYYARARHSVEERMRGEIAPLMAKRDLLAAALQQHEREAPLPPQGALDQLLHCRRYRALASVHERTRQQLALSIQRVKSELTSCEQRWSGNRCHEEVEREQRALWERDSDFKVLEDEHQLAVQRVEAKRDLCRAEYRRLRPNDSRALEFVHKGRSVIGMLVAVSQIEGCLRGFLDCGRAVYCIRLPWKGYLEKIACRIQFDRPIRGREPEVVIRDFEGDDAF